MLVELEDGNACFHFNDIESTPTKQVMRLRELSLVNVKEIIKHQEGCYLIDMSGLNLCKENMAYKNFNLCDFKRAKMNGVQLWGAAIRECNLSWTKLNQAKMRHVIISSSDLSFSDLRGADLTGAEITNTDLRGIEIDKYTCLDNIQVKNCEMDDELREFIIAQKV